MKLFNTKKKPLNLVAYSLAFVYLALFANSLANHVPVFEPIVFVILFFCALGVFLRKEMARLLLRSVSLATSVYFILKLVMIPTVELDLSPLAIIIICAIVIFYYHAPLKRLLRALPDEDLRQTTKWTVLIIDDDRTFQRLVKSYFLKHGILTMSAETGERGIEAARREKPDMIILDVILPGLKGRTVCSILKEDPETKNIPVMFVTFKGSLDDISAELAAGAVMHLTKPVDFEKLHEEVKKILEREGPKHGH